MSTFVEVKNKRLRTWNRLMWCMNILDNQEGDWVGGRDAVKSYLSQFSPEESRAVSQLAELMNKLGKEETRRRFLMNVQPEWTDKDVHDKIAADDFDRAHGVVNV